MALTTIGWHELSPCHDPALTPMQVLWAVDNACPVLLPRGQNLPHAAFEWKGTPKYPLNPQCPPSIGRKSAHYTRRHQRENYGGCRGPLNTEQMPTITAMLEFPASGPTPRSPPKTGTCIDKHALHVPRLTTSMPKNPDGAETTRTDP